MKKLFLLVSIIILFSVNLISAKEIKKVHEKTIENKIAKVEILLSKDEMTVADSMQLTLKVTVPSGYQVKMPTDRELGFSYDLTQNTHRFRPTDISEIKKTKLKTGDEIVVQSYTLEPWLSDNYSVPPILFSFFKTDKNGKVEEKSTPSFLIYSEAIRIFVKPMPDSKNKMAGLMNQSDLEQINLKKKSRRYEDKSLEEIKNEDKRAEEEKQRFAKKEFPWKILWISLGVILFLILLIYVLKKKGVSLFTTKKIPAHILAFKELKELLAKNLLLNGFIKEYYYELSYILRRYIERRYSVYALHQSSEEFLQSLMSNNPFDSSSEEILNEFNDLADTVKFSLKETNNDQANNSFNIVEDFVKTTALTDDEKEA
ncbi:MAG: hypothetical protein COA79_24655 [Planctomycetota bacterium]|nr:MAG: hypothetical protein COA79_24655 [Planctomycetota bacterium]